MTDERAAAEPAAPGLPPEVRRVLPSLVLGRLASNVGVRFPFTFIAVLARAMGTSVDAVGLVLGLRELTGLAAPWLGRRSDAGARNRLLAGGLGVCGVAMLLGATLPLLWVLAVALVLHGLGKGAHDTSSNGWIGDRVPFARRGRVTGLVETSWATAVLVAVPLLGLVIEATDWRMPFVLTGVASLVLAVVLGRALGPDPVRATRLEGGPDAAGAHVTAAPPVAAPTASPDPTPAAPTARRGPRRPTGPALAVMATLSLLALGLQLATVVFGAWLEERFGFGVASVGTAFLLFGAAELVGSVASARFTDAMGKRRSVLIGMLPMVPCLALLGFAEGSTLTALLLFTAASAGFEFAFVSALPILTEVEPDARAATVGQAFAAFTATRAVATIVGAAVYVRWGMSPVGLLAAVAIVVGIVVVVRKVEEPDHAPA